MQQNDPSIEEEEHREIDIFSIDVDRMLEEQRILNDERPWLARTNMHRLKQIEDFAYLFPRSISYSIFPEAIRHSPSGFSGRIMYREGRSIGRVLYNLKFNSPEPIIIYDADYNPFVIGNAWGKGVLPGKLDKMVDGFPDSFPGLAIIINNFGKAIFDVENEGEIERIKRVSKVVDILRNPRSEHFLKVIPEKPSVSELSLLVDRANFAAQYEVNGMRNLLGHLKLQWTDLQTCAERYARSRFQIFLDDVGKLATNQV